MTARILIVEDDKILRKACEVSLAKQGFSVLTASDGEEGLRQAASGAPDLILLDMRMPKLSGLDTLVALKQDDRTKAIPVVILSNSSGEEGMKRARELGAAGYWVKATLSLRELGDRINGFLGAGRA
ncbi:MAG: response regulator [Acidobacteriota bacterium]|jgi:DNA-binding response OmpR family regulator|nr:response regulator [Acidobacteriota bacterium]